MKNGIDGKAQGLKRLFEKPELVALDVRNTRMAGSLNLHEIIPLFQLAS